MTNTNVYLPEPVKVLQNLRETTENFRLVLDIPFKNEPGQFVQISLLGIGEAPISIASWDRDYLMLHIREVGTVTRALGRCKPGDTVFIRGPYGKGYPMKEAEGRNLIVVAGGCGVASVKGVFDYLAKNRDKYREVYSFVGYRNSKEVIFEDFVEEWRKSMSLFLSLDTLKEGTCYDATEGFVSDLVKITELPKGDTVAILCGPPIMMKLSGRALLDKGMREDRVYVSEERLMYCATGTCCHCMIGSKFTCKDGPVFRWDELKEHTP
jgi:anaerobic sulfite reductase subunit B